MKKEEEVGQLDTLKSTARVLRLIFTGTINQVKVMITLLNFSAITFDLTKFKWSYFSVVSINCKV